jgi:hypothetical protein
MVTAKMITGTKISRARYLTELMHSDSYLGQNDESQIPWLQRICALLSAHSDAKPFGIATTALVE